MTEVHKELFALMEVPLIHHVGVVIIFFHILCFLHERDGSGSLEPAHLSCHFSFTLAFLYTCNIPIFLSLCIFLAFLGFYRDVILGLNNLSSFTDCYLKSHKAHMVHLTVVP